MLKFSFRPFRECFCHARVVAKRKVFKLGEVRLNMAFLRRFGDDEVVVVPSKSGSGRGFSLDEDWEVSRGCERPLEDSFTECEVDMLKDKGYTVVEPAGEGGTRTVWVALYSQGRFKKLRVLKVLKNLDSECSRVGPKISALKGNSNLKELVCASEIDHPNISSIIDTVEINDKTVNIEEYIRGQTLEEIVKQRGSYGDRGSGESFRKVFGQVISGLAYLHSKRRMLHRDIKPSNIMIDKEGNAKITDLQTVAHVDKICEDSLPTHGGVPCTHPELLNAIFKSQMSKASYKTDIYSLGATMYFALTGKYIFGYDIKPDSEGKELDLGGEKVTVSLFKGGEKLGEISKQDHEKMLLSGLKKVPRRYRRMLHKCLSLEDKFANYGVLELEKDFEETSKTEFQELWEQTKEKAKWVAMTTLLASAFGSGAALMIDMSNREPVLRETTLNDILMDNFSKSVGAMNMSGSTYSQDLYSVDELRKHFEKLPRMMKDNEGKISEIKGHVYVGHNIHAHFNERLINSLLTSIALEPQGNIHELAKSEKRFYDSLVPEHFVHQVMFKDRKERPHEIYPLDERQKAIYAGLYLSHGIDMRESPADAFAKYFFSREEIAGAMQRAKSTNYFYAWERDGNHGSKLVEGYGKYLPPGIKKKLVDRAVAVYLMASEDHDKKLRESRSQKQKQGKK